MVMGMGETTDINFDIERLAEWPVPNTDYTLTLPPIPGTYDPREDWHEATFCECEIDWRCGNCADRVVRLDCLGTFA